MLTRRQLFRGTAVAAGAVAVPRPVPVTPTLTANLDTWFLALLDEKGNPLWRPGAAFWRHLCLQKLMTVPSEPGVLDALDVTFDPGPESGQEIHGIFGYSPTMPSVVSGSTRH